jgi:glycerol-3-phosphate dehydrogenase
MKGQKNTALLNRDHTIVVSTSGLVTITGGKWTTYRKMAKDVVNNAAFVAKLPAQNCKTDRLKIHGYTTSIQREDPLFFYGSDAANIKQLWEQNPLLKEPITPGLPYTKAEIIWAVQNEMAMTVEDVLARRTRLLFLDARAALAAASDVAVLMANELQHNEEWITQQIEAFDEVANNYILNA